VQGLLREVEDDGGLSRETQDMHPHKGVEPPPRGGVLEAFAFVGRKGGLVVLERGAPAVLSGRIDEHTAGHHHDQGHDALGLVEREGGGQKLRGSSTLNRLSLPKTLSSLSDQDAFNQGMQGVHPVPERLPSRQAISGPVEMPTQAPDGQGHLAYSTERAA
jgi:hypothetical protein